MEKPVLSRQISKRAAHAPVPEGFLKKITALLLGKPSPVGTRPISARDSFSKRPPNHVYSPARLNQMADGARPNLRPTDQQLTQFCSKIMIG